MRRPRPFSLLLLLPFMLAAVGGCAVSPPEWGCFDVDRHPVGAVPSQAGFYAGAYVVYPLSILCMELFTLGHWNWGPSPADNVLSAGIGVATGVVLGAPFHLVALPFGAGEGTEIAPEEAGR